MLLTGSADHTVQAWDVAANLTLSDRHALAGFARTLSPFALAGSGRLQMHTLEPRDTLSANAKLFSGAAGAFAHWFFAAPAERPLTPYATTTLARYVGKRLLEKSDFSRNQVVYFSHELPADSLSNVVGDSNYVRVQVLTPIGVLDREKQLGVVKELTDIVAAAAGDPGIKERTWVLLTESPEGGWGINGHANTGADLVQAARAALAARKA